jgi:hypothetical protein
MKYHFAITAFLVGEHQDTILEHTLVCRLLIEAIHNILVGHI